MRPDYFLTTPFGSSHTFSDAISLRLTPFLDSRLTHPYSGLRDQAAIVSSLRLLTI